MYKIKHLTKKDIVFICNLMSEPHNISALHTGVILLEDWQKSFAETKDSDEENFIVYKNSIPCAWLKLNGLQNKDTAWISMLVVSEAFKHQGVGKYAVEFAVDYLIQKGYSQIKIHFQNHNR